MDKSGRGWNDPPSLPLAVPQSAVTAAKRPGINLNKRVAFPLSGPSPGLSTAGCNSMSHNATAPPKFQAASAGPPRGPSSIKTPPEPTQEPECSVAIPNIEKMLSYLEQVLLEAKEIEHRDDIVRRFDEMMNQWREGVLDDTLCDKLIKLLQAIMEKDLDLASSIQLEIMTSWPSESSKWSAALRCVINHMRLVNTAANQCPDTTMNDEKPECDQNLN